MSCQWPFCNQPDCEECKAWNQAYDRNLTDWEKQKQEIRAVVKAARHRARTQAGGNASEQPT